MNDHPPSGPDTCELDRVRGREALDAWARRWLHHLHTGCRRCRASLAGTAMPDTTLDRAELAHVLEKAQAEAPHLFADTVQDRETANRFVDRLGKLSPEQQRLVIANSRWAGTPDVCDVLVERSLKTRWIDESRSLLLAELAAQVARRHSSTLGSTLLVRALTALGAARRLTSDFDGAAQDLAGAVEVLEANGSDPQLLAEIRSIQAALNKDRGRFATALRQNYEASMLYARCGDLFGEAQTYLRLGAIHYYAGRLPRITYPVTRALHIGKLIDNQEIRFIAILNLIDAAVESKDLRTAGQWLKDAQVIFSAAAPLRLMRNFEWIQARYDCGRGAFRLGITKLRQLREVFKSSGMSAHLSSVSLDLAKSYIRCGRYTQARRLLLESLEICKELKVVHQQREALELLSSSAPAGSEILDA